VLDGELTRDAAIELDARRNVAFAKRQRTWFRSEPGITWIDATTGVPDTAAHQAVSSLLDGLVSSPRSRSTESQR
jgi:tRNA A37 N6-isopentenylltransferase MiaA